jgi:hypothetical protein
MKIAKLIIGRATTRLRTSSSKSFEVYYLPTQFMYNNYYTTKVV